MNLQSRAQNYRDWIADMQMRKAAAADTEAISGIKDPNEAPYQAPPAKHLGNDRAALGLPANRSNLGEKDLDRSLFNVTKPNAVGEGRYIVPGSGNAKEDAATSPTTPLNKIAESLNRGVAALRGQQQVYKQAAPAEFSLPTDLNEPTLQEKLASIALAMLGTSNGQQIVAATLEKEAGIREAQSIIASMNQDIYNAATAAMAAQQQAEMQKYAAAVQELQHPYMQKMASIATDEDHARLLDVFETDLEKIAYMQGADDAAAADAAMGAGAAPAIEGSEEMPISDEEVLGVIQQLVQSGELSPDDAEGLLQIVSGDQAPGYTEDEAAAILQQAVASGQLDPQMAQLIAQQLLAEQQGGGMPAGPAPVKAASYRGDTAAQAAAVVDSLFGY